MRCARRGRIAAVASSQSAALIQIGAILATGNDAIVSPGEALALKALPPELAHRVTMVFYPLDAPALAGALFEGNADALGTALRHLAGRPGPIVRSRRSRRRGSPPARTTISPISSRNARSQPTSRRLAAMRA